MGIPPRTSAPPGRLSDKHAIGMALIIVGLIIGSAIIMIWIGLRFLVGSRQGEASGKDGAGQGFTIQTPAGSLEVQGDVNRARLGLPIYPGGVQVKTSGSATINLQLPNDQTLRVWTAKYETPDSLEQVSKFYGQQLQQEGVRHQAPNREGKTVYEIKQGDEDRIVALETHGDLTWIQLARVVRGATGPN
ncbi:MAG TPA: hypothetical protein VMV34_04075 [Terriglobia bacterium]|nr:hypothetical protein [Terriglobia bacterium]